MKNKLKTITLLCLSAIFLIACGSGNDADVNTEEETSNNFVTYDYLNKVMNREKKDGDIEYKYADYITIGEYKDIEADVDFSIKDITDEKYNDSLKSLMLESASNGEVLLEIPELTEELVTKIVKDNQLPEEIKTVEQFEKFLREGLEKAALDNFNTAKFESAIQKIIKGSKYTNLPIEDYNNAYDMMIADIRNTYDSYSKLIEWEDYLKASGYDNEEALIEECKDRAAEYIQRKLAIIAISDQENFTVSEEEFNDCINYYVSYNQYEDVDMFMDSLGAEKDSFIEERYYEILYYKVYDYIIENAKEINIGK